MNNGLDWAVVIAATWRLSYMLVHEDGLFDMFDALRKAANKTPLSALFACEYCMSVWIGALFVLGHTAPFLRVIVAILAVSAGAILIKASHDLLRAETRNADILSEETESKKEIRK